MNNEDRLASDIKRVLAAHETSKGEQNAGEAVLYAADFESSENGFVSTRNRPDDLYAIPLYTHPAQAVSVPDSFKVLPDCVRAWRREGEQRYVRGGMHHLEVGPNEYKEPTLEDDIAAMLSSAPTAPAGNTAQAVGVPDVVREVIAEVAKATTKFPTWPTDPLHALGVVHEEVGELSKAVLQQVYEPHKNDPDDVRTEAVQAAAMCLRFIASLDTYEFTPGAQHEQAMLASASTAPAVDSRSDGNDPV